MQSTGPLPGVVLAAAAPDDAAGILSADALSFVAELHRRFNGRRESLLARRAERQRELDAGAPLEFLAETAELRAAAWVVAPAPADLDRRWVEITGPADRKMMINALNSGADCFMADLEDSLSPTWENVVRGQQNIHDAVRRTISFANPDGREYRLGPALATLIVRPRGWHLVEKHCLVDGAPVSASLFDFGLVLFHNARAQLEHGSGPYFYLPKLESHIEARLWNEVFVYAQETLGLPRGTIRATVLIETLPAAFEMEEMLYELREHAAGLNAGRWDYIFSFIKKRRGDASAVLPDRAQVTMTVPFMRAYARLLVATCHRRGAHAMGGMAAFIPNRKDLEVTERALAAVRADKGREAGDGFDGTWVAHPDLVPVARAEFERVLGDRPNQKELPPDETRPPAAALLDARVEGGRVTENGVRTNVSVALQYLSAWLQGDGAAAINNLMEDAATAEISRAQLWQWMRHGTRLDDGRPVTPALYERVRDEELRALGGAGAGRLGDAAALLDRLVLAEAGEFPEFLTIPAYEHH